MSKTLSRIAALEEISNWNTSDLLWLLQKNGLDECCKAVQKRQIDGDEFLHLTEGKLALWKSDLTRPLTWNLWRFVEELKKSPEKYVAEKVEMDAADTAELQQNEELSDSGSWGTDFEDDDDEDPDASDEQKCSQIVNDNEQINESGNNNNNNNEIDNGIGDNERVPTIVDQSTMQNSDFRNSLMLFRENERATMLTSNGKMCATQNGRCATQNGRCATQNGRCATQNGRCAAKRRNSNDGECAYTNCDTKREIDVDRGDDNAYANCAKFASVCQDIRANTGTGKIAKNVSKLHEKMEKTLAEQLQEELRLRYARRRMKGGTTIDDPLEMTKGQSNRAMVTANEKKPQKSFLHDVAPGLRQQICPGQTSRLEDCTDGTKRHNNAAECGKSFANALTEKTEMELLPRPPPLTIRNFDLVANLPTRIDESDDEYETFDERIIEENRRLSIARADSKQSLGSATGRSSLESVYKTPSVSSQEKRDEEEIVEVNEKRDEEYEIYESITETPEDDVGCHESTDKDGILHQRAPPPLPAKPSLASSRFVNQNERSPDKKSATLPHSGIGTTLTSELRATRPLPPPPDKQSYMDSPWFHNITREQATTLIKERAFRNGQNGYFLLRPSTSHPNNPLALVLWFKDRVYNVPVRKRPDHRYALGSAKINEQTFGSVEEIVKFYSREELVLHTGGVQTGGTKLTDTPPK